MCSAIVAFAETRELLLEPGFERQHQGLAAFLANRATLSRSAITELSTPTCDSSVAELRANPRAGVESSSRILKRTCAQFLSSPLKRRGKKTSNNAARADRKPAKIKAQAAITRHFPGLGILAQVVQPGPS